MADASERTRRSLCRRGTARATTGSACVLELLVAAALGLASLPGCAQVLGLDDFHESGGATDTDAGDDAEPGDGNTDGQVVGPDGATGLLNIYPKSYNFGDVSVGNVSAPYTFSVVCASSSPIGPLTIFGGDSPNPNFTLVAHTCEGATLSLSDSCTMDFVFAPKSLGPHEAPVSLRVGTVDYASATLHGRSLP